MQYKIIVDKQSRTNPSDEAKEYIIDIEELRCKGNVYDSLVITKDEDYVMRRLALSEYGVLSVLSEEVKEPLEDVNIELFEGDNYIYLVDMTGNKFYAEYLVKNDFTDTYVTVNQMNSAITQTASQIEITVNQTLEGYSTTEEMNAAITQTAEEISSEVSKKVGEDEIISKINQSAEKVAIQADKIALEGYTTINGGFSVDENGNASVANDTVIINQDGITLADGTSIVGGKGVYTSLTYTGKTDHVFTIPGQGNFQLLGFTCDASSNLYKNYLFIDVFVPSNFTLAKAYLNIQHLPLVIGNSSGTISSYGICSQMKLYQTDINSQQMYIVPQSDTSITGISGLSEISVLGSSGWTPTKPTSVSGIALEQKNVEIDISYFATGGNLTRFAVATAESVPTVTEEYVTMCQHCGAVIASITLIGYMKDITF